MDTGTSSFFLGQENFHSLYYRGIKEENAIDLGLSLRSVSPQPHQPALQMAKYEVYHGLKKPSQIKSQMTSSLRHDKSVKNDYERDETRCQSRDRTWTYVKVNMDGVVVGRKICIIDHGGYSTLALQLEDMFGNKSESGIRLFQAESEYSLLYKDVKEIWRNVGDVSWNEFIHCAKRIRIAFKS